MGYSQELADSIVHRYLSLVRYQRSRNQEIKREVGQSGRRLAILRCLLDESPRTVGQIGRYLYVSDATVSRILDDMETQGFVTRKRCTKDSRKVMVEPTEAGRQIVDRAPQSVVATMRALLPGLDVEELTRIDWALQRLAELVRVDVSVTEE